MKATIVKINGVRYNTPKDALDGLVATGVLTEFQADVINHKGTCQLYWLKRGATLGLYEMDGVSRSKRAVTMRKTVSVN